MKKIYILDAVNYLFRSYYAIGPMLNAKGESTSALFGFIRSLLKLIKDFSPTHLVAVFDGPDNKKSRQAVYADYKMHRKGAPEDLFPQFEWAYEFCAIYGIPTLCIDGVEADDTIASVAVWARSQGAEAYICSSDKDLMQLVDGKIFLLQTYKDNLLINPQKVEELFGVRPDQMLDLLAMMGDSSDNIPGLEGFGPKTAAALLQEFGNLDAILAHPEQVKGAKKQQVLKEQKATALLSRELATLDLKVKVPKEESFYAIKPYDRDQLVEFYHRMHFNSLLRELGGSSTDHPKPREKKARHRDQHLYHLIDRQADFHQLLARLSKAKEVGIDTETTGLDPMRAELIGIGFSIEPGEAWYVPCNGALERDLVIEGLREFFQRSDARIYGHNLKYDLHILQNCGISIRNPAFDTMLASYLLAPQSRRHNLDDLALEHFKKVKIPIESLLGKGKTAHTFLQVPLEQAKEYCCEDVDYTGRLKELFEEQLAEQKLEKVFYDVEMPLLPILARMEREGIYLDADALQTIGASLERQIEKLKGEIFAQVGCEFNLNSPKQLSEILYQKLGLKPPGRKTTEFATGADILEELAVDAPIVKEILSYRQLEKLRTTYIDALPAAINPDTGRIHCTFNQSVAATGRLSSQDPNLQNIPVRSEIGTQIRSCFKSRPGYSFVGADYSQIELRLLAHFSKDPELIAAFKQGEDIHTHTASRIFDVFPAAVTSQMRDRAKTVNFAILYGQGPFGLSRQLGISTKEASQFIKTYFERYPRVADYIDWCKKQVQKQGFSTTLTGRRRPIPEIDNKNPSIRAAAERLAVNTPLQGTAADLIKMAMIAIDKEISKQNLAGKMILQIHDELIFEVPDSEVRAFQSIVKENMENVLTLNVPIEVHLAVGKNWGEC
jgi:DNA polymerase-1